MACITALLVGACGTPPPPIPLTYVEPAVSRGLCLVQVRGGRRIDILELNGHSRTHAVPFDPASEPPHSERVSPDGTYLVSTSIDDKNVAGIGLDGRLLWQIRNVRASRPAISPDGTKVVLISKNDSKLAVYDVPSGQLKTLGFAADHAVWAPARDRLAYDDGANIRIHDLASNATIDRGPGTEPSWLADGKSVRLGSKVDLVNVTTGERRELFTDARSLSVPRWSPDGEWMMYTRRGRCDRRLIDWTAFVEPTQVVLRLMRTGAGACIGQINKPNLGDFTWTTSAELCRSIR